MKKRIVIASDHAGVALKKNLRDSCDRDDIDWIDVGTHADLSVDYPDFAFRVVALITEGEADCGIAICGSGVGMSIAVNRHPAIRGALCLTPDMARLARAHNDANVLCLGARLTAPEDAIEIARVFLSEPFEGGRHQRRVAMLSPPDDTDHGTDPGCCGGACR